MNVLKSCLAALSAALLSTTLAAQTPKTLVRVTTDRGPVDLLLYDNDAPKTVTNFLNYVRRGAYDSSFFHRLASGFVLQGGGFRYNDATTPRATAIPADPAVQNEFSPSRSNVRGTIAMAKLGGNPDSATNQWFINLGNNAGNLDGQNGGFTVFGRVTSASLPVVDALAALNGVNAQGCSGVMGVAAGAVGELPLSKALSSMTCNAIYADNLVMMRSVRELPRSTVSSADRIFNYLEAAFPQYANPANPATLFFDGYTFRHYTGPNSYVGAKDGVMYFLIPSLSPNIIAFGSVADWLKTATDAGY
ncbi:peptidylprolyl isomerase [Inhella gelatinilytica]|uniref:peptidylprolyl isomerase n=1 Tax=Inhella gelatinilytica TaxID=2795030 RepID=A0A931IZ65_9BURK|nr:peptidylprolyl isomerase [Inhella gelatinilytica]MBH9553695.1 peptidylprolyl isomerase [Inhella gelatinilytica]